MRRFGLALAIGMISAIWPGVQVAEATCIHWPDTPRPRAGSGEPVVDTRAEAGWDFMHQRRICLPTAAVRGGGTPVPPADVAWCKGKSDGKAYTDPWTGTAWRGGTIKVETIDLSSKAAEGGSETLDAALKRVYGSRFKEKSTVDSEAWWKAMNAQDSGKLLVWTCEGGGPYVNEEIANNNVPRCCRTVRGSESVINLGELCGAARSVCRRSSECISNVTQAFCASFKQGGDGPSPVRSTEYCKLGSSGACLADCELDLSVARSSKGGTGVIDEALAPGVEAGGAE